jgi:hypothetical protein
MPASAAIPRTLTRLTPTSPHPSFHTVTRHNQAQGEVQATACHSCDQVHLLVVQQQC